MKEKMLQAVVRGLNALAVVAMGLMRWCAAHSKDAQEKVSEIVRSPTEYIPPALGSVNSILLNAAHHEQFRALEENPEEAQAILNACLESLRNCESVRTPMFRMFAALIAKGYDPEEAFLRVSADVLMLGMNVQKRLGPAPELEMLRELNQETT